MQRYIVRTMYRVYRARSTFQTAPVRPFSRYARRPSKSVPARPSNPEDAWTEVKDDASGQSYWWNTVTNETTHLGAPKPTTAQVVSQTAPPPPSPQQGQAPGLGQVVAEGFAFGTGSAIAHSVVGSIFGGFGGGHGGGDDVVDL